MVTRNPKGTSKDKNHISVDLDINPKVMEDLSICWVPFPMDSDLKRLLTNVSNNRSTEDKTVKIHRILHDVLRTQVDKVSIGQWKTETKDMIEKEVKELDVTDIQKMMEKSQRDLQKFQQMMELKRKESEVKK